MLIRIIIIFFLVEKVYCCTIITYSIHIQYKPICVIIITTIITRIGVPYKYVHFCESMKSMIKRMIEKYNRKIFI